MSHASPEAEAPGGPTPPKSYARGRVDLRAIGLAVAAPVLALLVAIVVTSLVLLATGDPVGEVWRQMLTQPSASQTVIIINSATVLYFSAIAVAIGFRMNLFNIGVDGQYRVAAFAAAAVGGEAWLPGPLNIVLILITAMMCGALWAGIAGWLKVTRGVSEVISTIMLNAIATGVVAWLLARVAAEQEAGSNDIGTKDLPESSRIPGLSLVPGTGRQVYGLIFLAILVGFLYWFVINRTRFGFDLRATGRSESAAVASGVDVKKMVLVSMLMSGAVAGLVGLPLLLGENFNYGTDFQSGLGFSGIAIALLGRNHPVGVALGALLWAYLEQQAVTLPIATDVDDSIVKIIQGVMVLAVVIAYEVVRRFQRRMEQQQVTRELAAQDKRPAETTGAQA
ncbi:simple sugar transport system permease protein [Barrientosiimonas humi]|uniref:Simple sugar transport system permease protein n=1 Tax=Barrientosiimonas humi TaxID=999931 RepID=A0A542XDY5_9MICO|nr:ABC transporter permease [Barrientosiimonas humi]TQL34042.1 simple sugar transport system permease protein [Barrientosiimonas humi]CAG7574032.1 D-allose transport system permease protein AlsC [Barrientosiimonas humi]